MSGAVDEVDRRLRRVFEPLAIGPVVVPNRIVRSAHLTGYASGAVNDRLVGYHLARAQAGVGLSFLEAVAVHPTSVLGLRGWDASCVGGYETLMAAVAPTGMRMFAQLWHGGHHYPQPSGGPPRGVSALPSPVGRVPAVPLDRSEIRDVSAAYVRAAVLAARGGIDGVELHAGHGYLIHQFLSALTNTRADEYGGSMQNRARFLVETLAAIRDELGEFPLGVRLSASLEPGGLREADVVEVAQTLVEQDLIDFLDVSWGDYDSITTITAGMERGAGYQLDSAGQITAEVTTVPRIVTGRFRTLEEADQVLRDGAADLVSMVRAHIADPEVVSKTRAGRPLEVRPCIGCNQGCVARLSGMDRRMSCVVNPSVGFEGSLGESRMGPAATRRQVVVVGGGPAGLEAARVARLRGHDVTLFEAQAQLGGTLVLAGRAPRSQGLLDYADWQVHEVTRLGVDVRLGMPVGPEEILERRPDVVLLATGADPDMSGRLLDRPSHPLPGVDLQHVLSSIDLLGGQYRGLGHHVVVFDEVGHYEGIAVCEFLLQRGHAVTVATSRSSFGAAIEPTLRLPPAFDRFGAYAEPPRIMVDTSLVGITREACLLQARYARQPERVAASAVVLVTHKVSRTELLEPLLATGTPTSAIGDARSARDLQVAIREGFLAAREI